MKIDINTQELNAKLNDAIDHGLHSIDQGLRRLEEVRQTVGESVRGYSADLQTHLRNGKSKVVEVEKVVENHVRQNPGLYVAAGVAIGFVIAAKLLFGRRSRY